MIITGLNIARDTVYYVGPMHVTKTSCILVCQCKVTHIHVFIHDYGILICLYLVLRMPDVTRLYTQYGTD